MLGITVLGIFGLNIWLSLLVVLLLVGAGLYVVSVLPLDGAIKTLIRVILIIGTIIYTLVELSRIA